MRYMCRNINLILLVLMLKLCTSLKILQKVNAKL
uniref:Uncharacterized protein n=1 Tax=Arundo donax TaxID=35708 RepID=A0A0A9H9H1_ARUDO